MPLSQKLLRRFCTQNPTIHLNVFLYSPKDEVIPFFVDPKDPQNSINLLYLPDPLACDCKLEMGHYVLIKNMSALVQKIPKGMLNAQHIVI